MHISKKISPFCPTCTQDVIAEKRRKIKFHIFAFNRRTYIKLFLIVKTLIPWLGKIFCKMIFKAHMQKDQVARISSLKQWKY